MNATPRATSTNAILSLVFGILGWVALPLVGPLVAVLCGHLARAEIRREPDRWEGDGMAVAGLVLGWVQLALALLAIIAIIGLLLFAGGLAALSDLA